jgi:hypothetical protein
MIRANINWPVDNEDLKAVLGVFFDNVMRHKDGADILQFGYRFHVVLFFYLTIPHPF